MHFPRPHRRWLSQHLDDLPDTANDHMHAQQYINTKRATGRKQSVLQRLVHALQSSLVNTRRFQSLTVAMCWFAAGSVIQDESMRLTPSRTCSPAVLLDGYPPAPGKNGVSSPAQYHPIVGSHGNVSCTWSDMVRDAPETLAWAFGPGNFVLKCQHPLLLLPSRSLVASLVPTTQVNLLGNLKS